MAQPAPCDLKAALDVAPEASKILRQLPKADLHVHFEGTVRPATLKRLLKSNGLLYREDIRLANDKIFRAPENLDIESSNFETFDEFIFRYLKTSEALTTAQDFRVVAEDYFPIARSEGIVAVEMYFTPFTFISLGRSPQMIIEGLHLAQQVAKTNGVDVKWIFDMLRGVPQSAPATLAFAQSARSNGINVRSIGLAGDETSAPSAMFRDSFREARDLGFTTLAHAGEFSSSTHSGSECIVETLNAVEPTRLGHGIWAVQDPSLLETLKTTRIPIEVCPISNVCLKAASIADHPLKKLAKLDLCLIICSDDPGIFCYGLSENYLLAHSMGISVDNLAKIARKSVELFYAT